MNRIHIMALVCMIGAPIQICGASAETDMVAFNPQKLTKNVTKLTNAIRECSEALKEISPEIQKIIGSGQESATAVLTQTDNSLTRHLRTIERIINTTSTVLPHIDQMMTKYSVRGGTVICSTTGLYLAYRSSQAFTTYTSANDADVKKEHFWKALTQGFFSVLSLSFAAYLYLYKWDAHLTMLPSLISTVAPITRLP